VIICADSGYDHARKMNLRPSIVLGDFDSISEKPADIPCLNFPARKDLTDTELAVEYARDKGFREFLLLGSTGSRSDHSLANILLLKNILDMGGNATIVDEHSKIMITDALLEINEPQGSIISLIPLTTCKGVTTNDLEYPLGNATMEVGKGIGISNIVSGENPWVKTEEGTLFVIVARD